MNLHRRIERHIRESGIPATRLGREAAGDPSLVRDLRNGRELGPALAGRLAAWLDAHEQVRGPRPKDRA